MGFFWFFCFYSTMIISCSLSSKWRWRRNSSPSTVILSFLSTIFIPCSSAGFADSLAVFLLLVCLKKNLLLAFMLLMICFSNLLGLTFCFSHLTCQSFCSFLFSLSGTTSTSWIFLWNSGQNGEWLIYQALPMDSVHSISASVGRWVQFHWLSTWLLEVLVPHNSWMDGSPGYGLAASEWGTPGPAQLFLLQQPVQLKAKASRF